MKQFLKVGGFGYHVDGKFNRGTQTYSIDLYSSLESAKQPMEKHRVWQLNLSAAEFDAYITELADIRLSSFRPAELDE